MVVRIASMLTVVLAPIAQGVDIVRDGVPAAAICVSAEASTQVREAAGLCAMYIEESSHVRLPVVTEAPAEGNVLYIGPNPHSPDLAGLDEDGFAISFPDERSIVIQGPTDWGTEYGVYEFLERYVGIRWLMPGESGTDIPVNESIFVPPAPVREEPAFFSRLFSGLQGEAQAEWARRNRMRGRVSFHHNLLRLFPPETYTESHP